MKNKFLDIDLNIRYYFHGVTYWCGGNKSFCEFSISSIGKKGVLQINLQRLNLQWFARTGFRKRG